MNYEESLAYIASLEGRGWRLELDRMEHFIHLAGLDSYVKGESRPQYFHVAGTNGKGSVTAFLQSALIATGHRTGGFFSPYVVDPRERVQIGGDLIDKTEFGAVATEIRAVGEQMERTEFGGVTEFEFKTAMGFLTWKRAHADAVALEVGLGGRLDATNVIQPSACGIVSIGLDHIAILGDSEALIAQEKAGIIKPGVPVVVGEVSDEAWEPIHRRAKEMNAPVWRIGHEVKVEGDVISTPAGTVSNIQPRLIGRWQMNNSAIAIGMLHAAGITDPRIAEGINNATAPGRFDTRKWHDQLVVLDGAHNGPAAKALAETLRAKYPGQRFTMISNMLAGHITDPFYREFHGLVDKVIIAPIFNSRARSSDEIRDELIQYFAEVRSVESIVEAFAQAEGAPILVTGSNYLVGDTLRLLDSAN